MSKLRAAVIGVGYLGTFHAQKYKALSAKPELNLELVAVCDLNLAQAQKVAGDLGVQAFSKYQELAGKVDLVSIATITPEHFAVAEFFLRQGVHVNVEKPITLRSDEAQRLISLASDKNLTLAVGHSERFNPAFQQFRKTIKNVRFLEFNRLAPFKARGTEVSVIHDLMIHDLDLMLCLEPSQPRLLTARAGKVITQAYDWATAVYEFKTGTMVTINCSRLSQQMTRTIRAYDESHQIVADLQNGNLDISQAPSAGELVLQMNTTACGKGDNLLAETEAFVRSIRFNETPAVTGTDGLRALQLVEEICDHLSSLKGSL